MKCWNLAKYVIIFSLAQGTICPVYIWPHDALDDTEHISL